MKRLLTTATAFALAVGVLAAPAFAGTTVSVDLWDAGPDLEMVSDMRMQDKPDLTNAAMGIKISTATVPAGEITFDAVNSSTDIEHEMVVANLAEYATAVPYKDNSGRVDENKPNMNIGEISELEPGESGSLTVTLEPGKYMLYCNVPGHYASGMWVLLTVE